MTKAAFFRELDQAYSLFNENLLQILSLEYDINKGLSLYKSERQAILNVYEILEEEEQILDHFRTHIKRMERSPDIIHSMSLIYMVAHFEVFWSTVTELLLSFFWESMKSKEKTISYYDALSFNSTKELRKHIISKEIYKVGFGGIRDRINFLEDRLNLIFEYEKLQGVRNNWNSIEIDSLIEVHSTRNIIIHNSGKIDARYLHENKASKFKIGENRELSKKYILDSSGVLFRVCTSYYNVARKKVSDKRKSKE